MFAYVYKQADMGKIRSMYILSLNVVDISENLDKISAGLNQVEAEFMKQLNLIRKENI